MRDILERLEYEPTYWLHSDERQMRRDAADEIRALRKQAAELEALLRRRQSQKMSRRSTA